LQNQIYADASVDENGYASFFERPRTDANGN